MKKDLVTVRNRETGLVGKVPRRIAEHSVFGKHLEIVPEGTKSRVPLGGGHLKGPKPTKPLETKKEKEEGK